MEKQFPTLFEYLKQERPSFLLLSISVPDVLKQSKITDHEIIVNKHLALEKRHWQKI